MESDQEVEAAVREAKELVVHGIGFDLAELHEQVDRYFIRMVLGQTNGNIAAAARMLRLNRTALHYKMRARRI